MQIKTKFDLDQFYSGESIQEWKAIIGEGLHYHYGYFLGNEDLETGLRQTVRNFYPHIPLGSRVLDVGCGWGGPANMITKERNCSVQGITLSSAQAAYCKSLGLNVWLRDLEQDTIEGEYDVVFMLEALSHIRNKFYLLQQLRQYAPRLILSVNCASDSYLGNRTVFGDSMVFCSTSELIRDVERAGWRIQSMRDRRLQSIPTLRHWKNNLDRVYGDACGGRSHRIPPAHLGLLRQLSDQGLKSIENWCKAFPLIDIIAD